MSQLSSRERDCLAQLAGKTCEPLRHCDNDALLHLLALGLIEETAEVRVPLPGFRRSFQVTVAGRAALEQGE